MASAYLLPNGKTGRLVYDLRMRRLLEEILVLLLETNARLGLTENADAR